MTRANNSSQKPLIKQTKTSKDSLLSGGEKIVLPPIFEERISYFSTLSSKTILWLANNFTDDGFSLLSRDLMNLREDIHDRYSSNPNMKVKSMFKLLELNTHILDKVTKINKDNYTSVGELLGSHTICKYLAGAYKKTSHSTKEVVDLVYNLFIKDPIYVYESIILNFEEVLGTAGLHKLKKLFLANKDRHIQKIALQHIADCQQDVDGYISACHLEGEPSVTDFINIATRMINQKQYKKAFVFLEGNKFDTPPLDSQLDIIKLRYLEICRNLEKELLLFEKTLSSVAYRNIINNCESGDQENFNHTCVQIALNFEDPNIALDFLIRINEPDAAADLVCSKITMIDHDTPAKRRGEHLLSPNHQLAATLLYRRGIDYVLQNENSRYYSSIATDLSYCTNLAKKISDWKHYEPHDTYLSRLITQHQDKEKFWQIVNKN